MSKRVWGGLVEGGSRAEQVSGGVGEWNECEQTRLGPSTSGARV